jgi:uncharacterized protein YceK
MSADMELIVLKFVVLVTICITLSGCLATGSREAEAQTQFDAAVKAQKKEIGEVCKRIQSEAQRRYCEQDPPQ